MKRRARQRGRTSHGAAWGAPLSPITLGDRSSRLRAPRRRRVVLPILAVALALVVAVVAAAGAGAPARRPHPTSVSALAAPPPPRKTNPRPRGARSALSPQETRAIDGVLRYTPFVALGTRSRREMALTFDDGPSPYTEQIVGILVRMHTPATFFIVGQQLTYFSAGLRDEVRHGFVIGDHTQNHAWLPRLPGSAQYAQIHDAALGVVRSGGQFPRLFRPPYGEYTPQTVGLLHQMKMLMVLWSIDPSDWLRPGTKTIVARVLSHARPGAIVIMHDGGGDRSQTAAALPAIINGLRRRHYELVTVPQLLIDDPPPRHQRLPELTGA